MKIINIFQIIMDELPSCIQAPSQASTQESNPQEGLRTEMRLLMKDMEKEARKIGPYFHPLEYTDPKTNQTESVFFLKRPATTTGVSYSKA